MEMIYLIFIIFLGGAVATYLLGKISNILRDLAFLATLIVPAVLFFTEINIDFKQLIKFCIIFFQQMINMPATN